MIAAAVYLALSGASIATERAFVMAAVALVAVMLDRRAISMRSVAIAAIIVLGLRPESLLSPGFHMSFAATTALVFVFSQIRTQASWPLPKWMKPVFAVALTSFIAGAASAPFAGAHFNGYAAYGLPANVLAVPIMGAVVMPSAVVALCLAPIGLEGIALEVMGLGLSWILGVASFFVGLEGARHAVVAPPPVVLPLLSFGALLVMLWQGRFRLVGLGPVAMGFILWVFAVRPDVLIDESSALVGVMTDQGRVVSKPRGQGFAARVWLENDGDTVDQKQSHARLKGTEKTDVFSNLAGHDLRVVSKKSYEKQGITCAKSEIIIAATSVSQDLPCTVIDPKKMAKTGALAIYENGGDLRIVSVAQLRGKRLWSSIAQLQ